MIDGQWQISYGSASYLFGTGLPTFNRTTPVVGDVDIRVADGDRPRDDGRSMGVDFRGGQTISFDWVVRSATEAAARAEASALKRIWRADEVRLVPGAVAELRSRYAGRERVTYGRPRRFAPDYSDAAVNHIVGVISDFACIDDVWYSTESTTVVTPFAPPLGGGLVAPLKAPLSTTRSSDRSSVFTVGGEMPTWPVIEIDGPITNPYVEIVGLYRFTLNTSLNHDETITIDTRPRFRSVTRSDGQSLAGNLTRTSPRLQDAVLPLGVYEVAFGGTDVTGTSESRLIWHDAFPTF